MDEANLCDRIALIQKGNILSIDTPEEIIKSFPSQLYAVRSSNTHKLLLDLRSYPGIVTCFAFGDALHATFKDGQSDKEVISYLHSKGHADVSMSTIAPSIEDCFIHLLKD
jgi:ABC-type multidrug transport system ATPase subunit